MCLISLFMFFCHQANGNKNQSPATCRPSWCVHVCSPAHRRWQVGGCPLSALALWIGCWWCIQPPEFLQVWVIVDTLVDTDMVRILWTLTISQFVHQADVHDHCSRDGKLREHLYLLLHCWIDSSYVLRHQALKINQRKFQMAIFVWLPRYSTESKDTRVMFWAINGLNL